MSKFYVAQVTRPDAGGTLWGIVFIENNKEIEIDQTPSYSYEAMKKRCDQLNEHWIASPETHEMVLK